jgi:hypothetical protein
MRTLLLVCSMLLLPTRGGAQEPAPVSPSTFVLRRGLDTVAVERFTRTGERLEAEVLVPGRARGLLEAELGPGATACRWRWPEGGSPVGPR